MVTPVRPPRLAAALPALLLRHRALFIVLALHALVWVAADRFISPHPDFIDHWMQSRVLSWGYYEHPPMVAWLIRGFSLLLGSSETALEAMAILVNLSILAALYALAVRTFGLRAARFTLLGVEATVYFTAGTPMLQIEQPLLLSWLGALAALLEYQRTGRPAWLLAMGAATGLGALSKYTMVLFYLGGLAYLLGMPERRRDLRNPWLYAGGLVSLLLFSPVIFWNAQNDWISFRYQLSKAGGPTEAFFGKHLLEFGLGALLLFSPVLAIGGAALILRRLRVTGWKDRPETLLAVMGLVPLGFFALAMVRGSFPDPKWANVGFLSFYLLLGWALEGLWQAGRYRIVAGLLGGALAFNAVALGLFALHAWRPLFRAPEGGDPTLQVVGWDETGRQVDELLRRNNIAPPRYVISFLYPLASQFALHLPSRPFTYSLKRPERNLWSPRAMMTPENTILVCSGRDCRWVGRLVRAQFGWRLIALGTVETHVWGVLRQSVQVMRPLPADALSTISSGG
jgi:4-amino-4-deoxy-L-arabinose transferase-like glycosyltransferase